MTQLTSKQVDETIEALQRLSSPDVYCMGCCAFDILRLRLKAMGHWDEKQRELFAILTDFDLKLEEHAKKYK